MVMSLATYNRVLRNLGNGKIAEKIRKKIRKSGKSCQGKSHGKMH